MGRGLDLGSRGGLSAGVASVALVVCLAIAGCGGGSGSSEGASSTTGAKGGADGSTTASPPLFSRGIKGESVLEPATNAHISARDCARLAALAERQVGARLTREAVPSPPLSQCRLSGRGSSVHIYLDTAHGAHIRYENRIVETVQFNTEHPSGLPQPVPHVGEKSPYNRAASWIPALGSLLAVRGSRWLTVTIAVRGRSDRELRDEAAVLARAGFKLTAE